MKNMEQDILKVLIEENSIQERVRSLGAQISRDYEGKKLLVLGVLKGSFVLRSRCRVRSNSWPCRAIVPA